VDEADNQMTYLYLHGFASGPSSSKAQFFRDKLNEMAVNVCVPDLNQPAFEDLTLTSQMQIIDNLCDHCPDSTRLVMIGSSMGGLLATMKSQSMPNLAALILMAPGFGLLKRWPAVEEWQERGTIEVFHYAYGRTESLSYQFIEDARKHQTEDFQVRVPTLVFHGRDDTTVPISESEIFARENPEYVELHVLDDDHQLLNSLEYIWNTTMLFIDGLQTVRM
jgi:pimeloyl-ACP methyl ester carboxylesterase